MTASNKILYFVMGALFAATLGWSFYRPVEAVAPSTMARKVDVLSDREVTRIQNDLAAFEKSIQEDRNFIAGKAPASGGKGAWSAQYAERKHSLEQNLPGKEKKLADLRAQLQTLRM